MNAYELAEKIQYDVEPYIETDQFIFDETANMLRQQADRIAKLDKELQRINANAEFELDRAYTTSQIKELSDEELNKAFDYYCETDEGVLRFNYELRDEWKKEQLIRWKEALKKASKK